MNNTRIAIQSAFDREVERRCQIRPITGEELDLIECLRAYKHALVGRDFQGGVGDLKKARDALLDQLALVESDNETRERKVRSELSEKQDLGAWRSEAAE